MGDFLFEKCTCGHEHGYHIVEPDISTKKPINYCSMCFSSEIYDFELPYKGFHSFKLDNLQWIEDEAKSKGII